MDQPYDYSYCELKNPAKDVRIMEIKPSGRKALEMELRVLQPAENNPNSKEIYNALSWCWRTYNGEPEKAPETVYIMHYGQRFTYQVSENLADALRALRDKKDPVLTVWVDSICINQKDVEERNNQVQLMSSIYGEAECVYVWLGQHGNSSELAYKFITELLKIDQFPRLVNDSEAHKKWEALKFLMMRDWFSRRWIIQEIALADRARLLCGDSDLDWKDFADAISLFNLYETETGAISKIMMGRSDYDHQPDFFGSIPALGAARLVEVTDNLFLPGHGKIPYRARLQSLEYLVSTFTPFNASEARDTVYAILAIARDSTPRTDKQLEGAYAPPTSVSTPLTPEYIKLKSANFAKILRTFAGVVDRHARSKPYHVNYSLPISDVYVEFVRFSIARAAALDPTRALDILCRSWAPDPDFHKPSMERASLNHGHWRAKFSWRRGNDGREAIDNMTREPIPQSPRPAVDILNEYVLDGIGKSQTARVVGGDERTRKVTTDDTLPSWAPSASRSPFGWDQVTGNGDRKMTRRNADLLVGDPSQRIYSASGNRGVTHALHFEDGAIEESMSTAINNTHYHSIYVEGFVLGTIEELSERSQGGMIPQQWADIIDPHDSHSDDAQQDLWSRPAAEDFWRTLVGDRGLTASNPPRCIGRIMSSSYDGKRDVDLEKAIFYGKHYAASSFFRRVHAVIWNRKLMRMKREFGLQDKGMQYEERNIGLVPDNANEGDLVCILYGCSVPVILRKYTKSASIISSQSRQQKMKAAQRIRTWWHGYSLGRRLENSAKEERAKMDADAARQKAARTPPSRSQTFKLPTTPKGRRGKRKVSADMDHAPEDQRFTRKTRHDTAHTWPMTPGQTSASSQAASPWGHQGQSHHDHPKEKVPSRNHEVFYRLIGECYVHRMMRGEAIDYQALEKLPSAIFEIR